MDSKQAPPAYNAAPPSYAQNDVPSANGVNYSDDKKEPGYGQSQLVEPPTGPAASGSGAVEESTIPGGIRFHVYKDGRWKTNDIVTAEDKKTQLYYLDFPVKWSGKWDLTLHRGSKEGPPIAKITKSGLRNTKTLTFTETGREIILEKTKKLSMTQRHQMVVDSVPWEWKLDGTFSMNWTLRRPVPDSSEPQVVARWQDSSFAVKKDGKLVVNGEFASDQPMMDIIIASSLAIQEWYNEIVNTTTVVAVT
ncbi:hypothetical protein BCR35DRAFT_302525 [Leucosporidium creatinivorum]|uniref:Tubby C-terminal-like domain-containing protein n=1 Tax=Leucosporidium creatinivorum TaxID=106004 RepID=A0A1Y2FPK8_9BASI|nr:hypothetical protein BCR35DRAFT_302525 [Leucosporidium creatinivorum]